MPKRRSSAALAQGTPSTDNLVPPPRNGDESQPPPKRRASQRRASQPKRSTNPNINANVLDGAQALRASPDASAKDERMDLQEAGMDVEKQVKDEDDSVPSLVTNGDSESPLSEISEAESPTDSQPPKRRPPAKARAKGKKGAAQKEGDKTEPAAKEKEAPRFLDPEAEEEEEADEEEIQAALSRPPPVNSDYLPLPWKGRLGYACLNTYLRFSNPPVFSSRTCRIASILENRHPLRDPNEPPHATKNRPDRDQPPSIRRGQEFVEQLSLANVRDISKMLRWNDRYGIKFMRLSSEMFPFASHEEYGYKLAPFASEALAEAGKVAAELGHRLTTHPGQYTQLGSPRKQVIDNALRDLDYHAEMLSLLKLPPQQDRDAVMILHLGGVFGDKAATIDRFRTNYLALPQHIKDRLVLENDDVSYSVHDILPLCEELNIPMVLDFHHHNIIFDADKIREGTKDIVALFPRILDTWRRKDITPKMHYSEPTPEAITGRQRRKHNPRVATLPPCPADMDLMIEAKDKEQAVFELMRNFKLPGFERFNDMVPHVRRDDNKPFKTPRKKKAKGKAAAAAAAEDNNSDEEAQAQASATIEDDEVGMGGPEGRVYWPPGQEHWLRPAKKVVKPKEGKKGGPPGKEVDEKGRIVTPAMKRRREAEAEGLKGSKGAKAAEEEGKKMAEEVEAVVDRGAGKKRRGAAGKKAEVEEEEEEEEQEEEGKREREVLPTRKRRTEAQGSTAPKAKRRSGREGGRMSYKEVEEEGDG
ncbi:MAG: hypothetical protein LQ351_001467 [Letrouitia transgressa]|nr:MAG: hypothetical protein LQ351_001467 [Letrouitia transgressa]